MRTPVITIAQNDPIVKVAKLMAKHGIGSVIVNDRKGKTTGIITERDIVIRYLAKDGKKRPTRASDIMSTPVSGIEPEVGIDEAARKMSKLGVRRLLVREGDTTIGVVSSRDILAMTPALITVLKEKASIGLPPKLRREPYSGYCENCTQWSDALKPSDGRLICDDCLAEVKA
ncbi:MAG: cyclic nucleotide-binding/CBS domain-containing protein [Candidatus Bathyarchaeia archaeon]